MYTNPQLFIIQIQILFQHLEIFNTNIEILNLKLRNKIPQLRLCLEKKSRMRLNLKRLKTQLLNHKSKN